MGSDEVKSVTVRRANLPVHIDRGAGILISLAAPAIPASLLAVASLGASAAAEEPVPLHWI